MYLTSALLGKEGPIRRLLGRVRRRHLLLPAIIALQLLILSLISLYPPIKALRDSPSPMSMFDVRASDERPPSPAPQPKPVEIVRPAPLVKLEVEVPAPPAEPVFSAAAAEQAGFGTTCDISETLARAFTANEFVKAELARIGPESRSVANAIMFWDGGWVEFPKSAPPEAIQTLRRAIVEGVKAAPAECLQQDLAGPRFVAITGLGPTMMLVLGSGAWRWEQILVEAEEAGESGPIALNERTK